MLPETVPEARWAAVADVTFPVTVKALSLIGSAGTPGVWAGASGLQGGNEIGVPGCRGLQPARSVGGYVHKDERGFLVSGRKRHGIGGRFPPAYVILDLAVVQSRNEPLDEEDVVPRRGVGIGKVKENPHPCVQLLDRLIRELDHASELSSQQLRVTLGKETALVLVQGLFGSFRSGEGDVHHGLQGGAFNVRIHELFLLLIGPSMVVRDDLEPGAPSQKFSPGRFEKY